MPSFGPTSTDPTSGEATVAGGSANGPLWPGDLKVDKLTATVVLGADYEAYGVVHKLSVSAVLGADYNAFGSVHKITTSVVLGNDPQAAGAVNRAVTYALLRPVVSDLRPVILSINT